MTKNKPPAVAKLHINQSAQTNLSDVFQAQYSHMEKGELRAMLEATHQPVWDEKEFFDEFIVDQQEDNIAHVTHIATKKIGTVLYTDSPRLYFDFKETESDK